MKSLEFRIRKLHVNTDADKRLQKRQPSRVYVNEEALLELTGSRDGGKPVCIEKLSASPDEPPVRREATLWKAPERLDKSVTQMYDVFRDACGYKLGEQVRITSLGGTMPDAEEVIIEQLSPAGGDGNAAAPEPIDPEDIVPWEFVLAGRLSQIEHVYAGLVFKNLFVRGPERSFVVASVNGRSTGNARYVDRKTTVHLATTPPPGSTVKGADGDSSSRGRKLEVTGVQGLDAPIAQLNRKLRLFDASIPFRRPPPYSGIVLHGGHGTGKTMLLDRLAATGWGTVFRIQYKDKLTEIQDVFARARLQQPSMVLIDQLDRLIDKDRSNRAAVILALCDALDALAADTAATGQMCKVLVVATCLDYTSDVPEDLKRRYRLTTEIYLPMPDAEGRRAILASLDLDVPPDQEEDLLRQLSERTHAYNGDDLHRLVAQAREIGAARILEEQESSSSSTANSDQPTPPSDNDDAPQKPPPHYLPSDYFTALRLIRPSAMHDINLKPPPIRWDDIGGQESVKTALRRAVRLSVEPPEVISQYFDRPPKGFLLYGPPGCSKTMAAQAMATESGLNFFAVKGAELLNMYVGESERAVRRLFQRAREVSPSMIFFDEIDSIAGQRAGFSHSSSSSSSSTSGGSHSGVNVLTTLLNEMDGFEALHGVVVLAATNRPQALDPALLRPGRFDELIYVSPPDYAARRAIFSQVAKKRRMHDDVDVDALAAATEGCSGAEIKAICATAGVMAYDRRAMGGEPAIMMADLEAAIRGQKRQITPEMLRGFEEWERQFRKF